MSRRFFLFVILILIFTGCHFNQSGREEIPSVSFGCVKGEMKRAWYEHGMDEPAPVITGLQKGFVIWVDTNLRPTNFISWHEEYAREQSVSLDTSDLDWTDGWDTLTPLQKRERVRMGRDDSKKEADTLHYLNNLDQTQIWIINNSGETVTIQMQDWSYICVLQARAKDAKWYPVEYWQFSGCGNSYYFKHFPPGTANSFIKKLPSNGDYKTKLRFKLLGEKEYYFSNEFDGAIDYCEFAEDSSSHYARRGKPQPHFRLDSLILVARLQ